MFLIRYFAVLLICSSAFLLSAQEEINNYLLYLKDGSFIKGTAIKETTNILHWQLTSGDVVLIPTNSVKRIEKSNKGTLIFKNGKTVKSSGSYHVLSTGVLLGKAVTEWEDTRKDIHLFHFIKGFKFNQHIAVGGGIGIDIYNYDFIPVFIDFRGDLLNKPVTPYYALNVGYGFGMNLRNSRIKRNNTYKGGPMINPSIGIRFANRSKVNYILEAGYKFQYGKIEYDNRDYEDRITFRRVAIKGGIIF